MSGKASILALFLWMSACSPDPCSTRGDMLESPGGLQVEPSEHGVGWGQPECFQCHSVATIHEDGCSSSSMTAEDIRGMFDTADPTSCQMCHGDNGTGGPQ